MGFYRLFLAFMVALSHADFRVGAFNPGIVAAISFFLLSGYVMTALIDRHYASLSQVGRFYLDRALRLYPQFLVYSLATIVAAQVGLRHAWMWTPPSLSSDLAQLTMAPLNCGGPCFPQMLMPQAWSLGLEVIFYAVFPLLLLSDKRLPFACASLTIFALSFCGRLDSEWFTYRLLPGNLFVFLLGSWLRRPEGRWPVYGVLSLAAVALLLAQTVWPVRSSVSDMLAGVLIGAPAIAWLARRRPGRWDDLAGNLSYGVFLNHNLLIPELQALLPGASVGWLAVVLLPASTALSWLSFRLVEAPALTLRHKLRRRAPRASPPLGALPGV